LEIIRAKCEIRLLGGGRAWRGYLQDYPDYWTQGESVDDLKEHLRDLYLDIHSGQLPGFRQVADPVIS